MRILKKIVGVSIIISIFFTPIEFVIALIYGGILDGLFVLIGGLASYWLTYKGAWNWIHGKAWGITVIDKYPTKEVDNEYKT